MVYTLKDEWFERNIQFPSSLSYDDFDVTNAGEIECPKSEYQ